LSVIGKALYSDGRKASHRKTNMAAAEQQNDAIDGDNHAPSFTSTLDLRHGWSGMNVRAIYLASIGLHVDVYRRKSFIDILSNANKRYLWIILVAPSKESKTWRMNGLRRSCRTFSRRPLFEDIRPTLRWLHARRKLVLVVVKYQQSTSKIRASLGSPPEAKSFWCIVVLRSKVEAAAIGPSNHDLDSHGAAQQQRQQ
jgi:hypothetical protein